MASADGDANWRARNEGPQLQPDKEKIMDKNQRWLNAFVGLAVVGSGLAGVTGFLAGVVNLLGGNTLEAGVLLIAGALSFGLLALALLGALRPGG
jgi:hypothetical protein